MLLSPSPAPVKSPVTTSPPPPLPVVVTSPPPLPPIAAPLTSPPSPPTPIVVLPPTSSLTSPPSPPTTPVVVLPPTSSVPPLPPHVTSTPPVTSPPPPLPPLEAPTLPVVAPPPIATVISPVTSPPSPEPLTPPVTSPPSPEPLTPPVTSPPLPTTPLAPPNSPPLPPISPSPSLPPLAPTASPPPPQATPSAPVTPPSPPPASSSIVLPSPTSPNDPPASALASPPPPLPSSSIKPPQTPNSQTSPPPMLPLPASPKQSHLPTGLIVTSVIGVVLLLLVLGFFCFCYKDRKKRKHSSLADYHKPPLLGPKDNSSSVLPQLSQQNVTPPGPHVITVLTLTSSNEGSGSINIQSENPITPKSPGVALGFSSGNFIYDELVVATNGFSDANLLGQGGFGYVHKGVLPNGKQVAVKQLKEKSGQGEREFQAEVETISRVHHKHLVSLVGYCITGVERLLVYEFLPNNTLEYHLHGKGEPVMAWATRLKIAIGCAKGLAYLHEDCNPTIIHRDIKAANILLDYKFEAKVSDFGLAKFFSDTNISVTHISTRVVGTFGYLAPEYAASGKVTEKSDVYSYGVMLLELITGRPPISTSESLMKEGLVEWARPLLTQALEDGNFNGLVDPRLEGNYNISEVGSMVVCAAACVRHSAWLRPQMSQIVRALEGDVPLKDFSQGIRPGHSSVYGYKEDIKKFNLLLGSQQYGTSAFSGTTSEYGLNPSSSSSDYGRQPET